MKQKSNPPCDQLRTFRCFNQISREKSIKLISNLTKTSLQILSWNFAAWDFSVNFGVVRVIPWASLGSNTEQQEVMGPILTVVQTKATLICTRLPTITRFLCIHIEQELKKN